MRPTDFAQHLADFLTHYLPARRNVSPHTVKSYRDAFLLLLRFCRDVRGLPPERLHLHQLDVGLVEGFLDWLEKERHCSIQTCNQRLAALHAFFRYLQYQEPARLLECQRILAIPFKKTTKPMVGYLTAEDLGSVLAQPDLKTSSGRRAAVLLSVLYDSGARVQELVDLSLKDVRLESPAFLKITGKGRKIRAVPLMDRTIDLLRQYAQENDLDHVGRADEPLFRNRRGGRLSPSGVRYIVSKYSQKARAIRPGFPERISPHWLRHSKGMHLMQAGISLEMIRDILGHADTKTTEIYARANIEMKRAALAKIEGDSPNAGLPLWQKDKNLMEWLRSL
jgi:site-specific recombinase XerD